MNFNLKIGEIIVDGETSITILDEVSFCYRVLTERRGKRGVRLISKSILEEFVIFLKRFPDTSAAYIREQLSGKSINDKYEYGYDSTFKILAKVVISRE